MLNLMYCVLIPESRLILGGNTAIFPEGFLLAVLILVCQTDDLFSLPQTVFVGRGTCPLPICLPSLPPAKPPCTGYLELCCCPHSWAGFTLCLGCSASSPHWYWIISECFCMCIMYMMVSKSSTVLSLLCLIKLHFNVGLAKGSVATLAVWSVIPLFYVVVAWQLGREFLL